MDPEICTWVYNLTIVLAPFSKLFYLFCFKTIINFLKSQLFCWVIPFVPKEMLSGGAGGAEFMTALFLLC